MLLVVAVMTLLLLLSLIVSRELPNQPAEFLVFFVGMEFGTVLDLIDKLAVSIIGGNKSELDVIVGLALFEVP
jgi:low temperature requirement protein LtrA